MTEEELRKAMKPYEDTVPSDEVIAHWAKHRRHVDRSGCP
jgi:hypothetical protein